MRSAREHEFAYELELTCREAGLTVAELAAALFCAPRTVRRYMNGERRPQREVVVRWEQACGTRAGRLTDRYDRLDVPHGGPAQERGGFTSVGAGVRRSRILFNLPSVAASFTGRDALLQAIDVTLRGTDGAVITQAITGPGGVGKTQLAAGYVRERADRYDLVAWIRAEDGGVADLAALAARMGIQVDGLAPRDRAQAALDQLAAGERRGMWLLVLDNVQSPEELERLLPRSGSGHVLVTTRDRALRQFAPLLTVDVFDEDTAAGYLAERAGRVGEAHGARLVARALGGLPLALSHAAAYCESGTSFATYLELLEELPTAELFDSHPEVSYSQTVASTWKASIAAATAQASLAGDILRMAAFLAPDAIPKSLCDGLVSKAGSAARHKRVADAFNVIARFNLAAIDDETMSIHRLLQRSIREEAEDDGAALRALDALCAAFPEDAQTPESWAEAERLLPHCLALAAHLSDQRFAAAQLIELLNRASWYLNNAEPGSPRSVEIARGTLSVAERALDGDDPERLMAGNHLATALQWAGRLDDAIPIFEAVYADRARVLGAEHEHTLISSSNLALAYEDAGRSSEAIEIYESLLRVQERIFGADSPHPAFTRHNLALSYKAAGRIGDAIAILEPLRAAREEALGPEDPETLKTRHHLASAYRLAGRPDDAIAMLEPLLPVRERIVGREHPHTLMTRHELARACGDAGRVGAAIEQLQDLVPTCERLLGAGHPDALAVRHSLAVAYVEAGRVDTAAALLDAVLADRVRVLGGAHRDTRETRAALTAATAALQREDPGEPPAVPDQ